MGKFESTRPRPAPRRFEVTPPSALGKGCHGGVAGRGIAVRRRSILVIAEHKRPHPRRASRSCMDLEDAADNFTARKHVEIVLVPVARNMSCGFPPEHCRLEPSSAPYFTNRGT